MARSLRFALLGAVLAAVWASPAHAARLSWLPETLTTQHFQIHYDGAALPPATPVLHQNAGDLAGILERAYTTYTVEWGYPAPLPDADGRIDVYVNDLSATGFLGVAFSDDDTLRQSSGYLYIDDDLTASVHTAAHELFHLVQIGQWQPMDGYVMEATAEWAGFRFSNFPATVDFGVDEPVTLAETLAAPDMSLTCSGPACGYEGYQAGGYSRWHFYEYLTERFGSDAVEDLFVKAKALDDPTLSGADLLGAMLVDKGATLADVYGDWTVKNMNGDYAAPGLKGVQPPAFSSTLTGGESGTLAAQKLVVNHLATRYVAFQRGGSSGPCYAATLNVTVTLPPGLGARPYYYWSGGDGAPVPLAINGSTASVSVPWDTCAWSGRGLVSLPNPSATVDAAPFVVNGTIVVDKRRIVTATPPPTPDYAGPTVSAPTMDEPPTIALYGPETLRISRKKRVVRLVVFSSGGGKLDAQLGAHALGERTLRSGTNDLRFTLPKTALRSLAATNTLTVTALSSNGVRGESVARKLVLTK